MWYIKKVQDIKDQEEVHREQEVEEAESLLDNI
jgi:hypothetical protein